MKTAFVRRFLFLSLVALGKLRRQLRASSSPSARPPTFEHANATASMISILPARAYTPCRTISALSEASLSLRTLSRRAQHPQALCSASSLASCTWSRDDVNLSRRSLVHTPWKHCGIRPASLFSTSTTRRLKLEDEATGSSAPRSGTEVGANFHTNSTGLVISEDTALYIKPDLCFLHVSTSSSYRALRECPVQKLPIFLP